MYEQRESELGLTRVASLDPGGGWEWDVCYVWKHEDGRLLWGQAAGCSCYGPEDAFESLNDLEELNDKTWASFEAAARGNYYADVAEKNAFVAKVDRLLRES